jgi:hypothetical protein
MTKLTATERQEALELAREVLDAIENIEDFALHPSSSSVRLARALLAECERADVPRRAFQSLRAVLATSSRDWSRDDEDAWIYGIVWGWNKLDDVLDSDIIVDVAKNHGWSTETRERLKQFSIAVHELINTRSER